MISVVLTIQLFQNLLFLFTAGETGGRSGSTLNLFGNHA